MLRLTIDREGSVAAAEVLEGLGYGLDESAQRAVRRFRFAPARRRGTSVAARILYRYEFRLPELVPASEPTVAPAPDAPPSRPLAPPALVSTPSTTSADRRAAATPHEPTPHEPTPREGARSPLEVTVHGGSVADRRRESAEAVKVIDTTLAKRESADLGEVLARTQGVGVRRAGGLGSGTRFSLNGFTDDQVRFFLDGVPLELTGFPFGIANVPVNLVERVEVFAGVVPVRYGADALGGAVDLVTADEQEGTRGAVSYEVGSFDTHRATLGAKHLDADSGRFARLNAFVDSTRNDYLVDVDVPDDKGRTSPARVRRFHDGYRASGANLEVGLVRRPWARRLLLRTFVTGHGKEYQHNQVMTVPYGGARYGELSVGGSLRYSVGLGRGVSLDLIGGYVRTGGHFLDVASCVYDWFGRCVRQRRRAGETDSRPHDQIYRDDSAFARLHLSYRFRPKHTLRVSVAPTHLSRTGDERRQADPTARDPLTAERRLTTVVDGVEYEADLFDDRLENIAFAKQYAQLLDSEEPRPGGAFRRRDRSTYRAGIGDALRYRVTDWLDARASYEAATRLPRPDEVFGDGRFIIANLELRPEKSHNLNVGVALDARRTASGSWRGGAQGFLRRAEELVVLLGNERVQHYENVYAARSLGVEAAAGWTSPGETFVWDLNGTYLDFRNASRNGTFGTFAGDRIPNHPWLFANYSARVRFRGVISPRDELALGWNTRFVYQYFRGWESIGLRASKQVIPSQLVHGAAVGYLTRGPRLGLGTTLELQNLADTQAFDYFGVQRPGRAFYLKTTAEL